MRLIKKMREMGSWREWLLDFVCIMACAPFWLAFLLIALSDQPN